MGLGPHSAKALQEKFEDVTERLEKARAACKRLYEFQLADDHLDPKDEMYEEGDEEAPFFSESYLYCLLGKEDARTVLAFLHKVEEPLGMRDGERYRAG